MRCAKWPPSDTNITPFDALLVLVHLQVTGLGLPVGPPPPFVDVDGNDRVSVDQGGTLYDVKAHTPSAEDGD